VTHRYSHSPGGACGEGRFQGTRQGGVRAKGPQESCRTEPACKSGDAEWISTETSRHTTQDSPNLSGVTAYKPELRL
jgi:hypothetical protein